MSRKWHDIELIAGDGKRIHSATCDPFALPGEIRRITRLMEYHASKSPVMLLDGLPYAVTPIEAPEQSDDELLADLGL